MAQRATKRRKWVVPAVIGASLISPSAHAAAGNVTLASTADDGTKSNGGTLSVTLSADGTHVAFSTTATNLAEGDTDNFEDVYVKDLATGELRQASTNEGTKDSYLLGEPPSLSTDGTRVAFATTATNPSEGDTDSRPDVYVRDLSTGEVILASAADDGTKSNSFSDAPSLSADGNRVAFSSYASNLDPAAEDGRRQVYVKDLTSGNVILVSASDDGSAGNGHSLEPSLSADGTRVAFSSKADNLDPADSDPYPDVYVKDLTTGDLTLVSTFHAREWRQTSEDPSVSADGRHVAFSSYARNVREGDPDHRSDIYVKDLGAGGLVLASTADDAVKGDFHSLEPSLSVDGSRVAFSSGATNLGEGDHDADYDIYVKDLTNGGLSLASTADDATTSNGISLSPSLSPDGATVGFISTATNLDAADTDELPDAYVKDVGDMGQGAAPPTCRNRQATVYVSRGYVVGGPDAGQRYTGLLPGTRRPDVMLGTRKIDFIGGQHGDDLVCGERGSDRLEGAQDDDRVFGGYGRDYIRGRDGRDLLRGEGGRDQLTGGPDADRFVGGPGRDLAKDYDAEEGDTVRSVP